jgi:carnitine 3-dehydrogenase
MSEQRVAIVGGGLMGSGWAAHFLRMGLDVSVYDEAPGFEDEVRRAVDQAWPALEELGLREGASPDRLTLARNLGDAVAGAGHVQEAITERLEPKIALFERLDELAPPDAILASSTSFLTMSDIQQRCTRPERTVCGHPFNPAYLIPLVEVVGGGRTSRETVDRACAFYAANGKEVIRLEREVPGYVANRMQEAIWREALHMIVNGEATLADIDRAIVHGPGIRWAIAGPGLTYQLAGGQGGMRHRLEQFGPLHDGPFTRLQPPELTDELRQTLIDAAEGEANGRTVSEMEEVRDASILRILRAREVL